MRDRPSEKHRTVVEHKIGHKISQDQVVHHVDENKANDSPINLDVKPRSDHTAEHNKTRRLSKLRKALTMPQRKEKLY